MVFQGRRIGQVFYLACECFLYPFIDLSTFVIWGMTGVWSRDGIRERYRHFTQIFGKLDDWIDTQVTLSSLSRVIIAVLKFG
ncbi:hypothetical protein EPI10_005348 [Gossypium australe]|uniref:Uncharacterized protein n=1 Tax=Gossypium australe TaxID=47621 RepID=A0A5B6WQ57_9ROSI|nr:hypothetical protein EPI10_005348 [Gossypium australe]